MEQKSKKVSAYTSSTVIFHYDFLNAQSLTTSLSWIVKKLWFTL